MVLILAVVVTAVALAYVCSAVSSALGTDAFWVDLSVSLLACGGFSLSTLLQHNGFEQKPTQLSLINSAYQLALFLGMGVAIGLLQ